MSSAPQLEGQNYFTATDFGVLNEIQKTVVTGTCETIQAPKCQSKVDLCFVIDSSGSIRDNNRGTIDNWKLQLEFISALSAAFNVGPDASRIGAVVFSEDVRLQFPLDAYDNNGDLTQAILNIPYLGSQTNTPEALVVTRNQCFNPSNGDRSDVNNLAIIVTDGVPFPNFRRQPAIEEARALRDAGVVMVSVGITDTIDEDFLKGMSSSPQTLNQNYFTAADFDALSEIQNTVVEETCETIETPKCFAEVDICFIVDSSGSIRDTNAGGIDNWGLQRDFLLYVVSAFTVGLDNTRIGVVVFSNNANLAIRLNQYQNADELSDAIENLGYMGGTTNTPEALQVTREQCFSVQNGDRPDKQNVAVIITDGLPNPENLRQPAIDEARNLRNTGVVMTALGITDKVDVDFVKQMASPPQIEGQNYFRSTSFLGLASIQNALVIGTCGSASTCPEVVDLCVVLDAGGRTSNDDWQLMKAFAADVVRAFNVGTSNTRVGLVTFGNNAEINFGLDQYIDEDQTTAEIANANFLGGGVNTADGLKAMREQCFSSGDRPRTRNVGLLITDELPTINQGQVTNEATRAKNDDTYMISVGVTNSVDENTIRGIASAPQRRGETYFIIPSYAALDTNEKSVVEGACNAIKVAPEPPPLVECKQVVDMCIIVDASGSIRDANPPDQSYDNWDLLLKFVSQVVDSFQIGRDATRVGAVVFSDNAQLVFDLNRYQTEQDIKNAIMNIPYLGSFTNFAAGLRVAREQCFNLNSGNRRNTPDIALLITDGYATSDVASTLPEAELLKGAGAHVMTVGITDVIDEDQLRTISSPPQQLGVTWFKTPDFRQLNNILESLVTSSCTAPTPTPIPCAVQADVCFVIDSSGSIRDNNPPGATLGGPTDNWTLMLEFVSEIIGAFSVSERDTHIGVVVFSSDAIFRIPLTQYYDKRELQNQVKQLSYIGGFTNTADALRVTRQQCFSTSNGNRASAPDLAIVVTDGVPTLNTGRTEPEAMELKRSNVEVIAVGITNNVDTNTLRMLSSSPQERNKNYFEAPEFTQLGDILDTIILQACATEEPTVIVPGCEGGDADVVFVIDESGSINNNNFEKVTAFVADVIEMLDIETGRIRVGVMTFSDDAKLVFNMNQYRTRPDAAAAVRLIPYRLGRTNTADAIRFARVNMFTTANGARPNSNKIMIIITDGGSNDEVQTMSQAKEAKDADIHIMSVGIGSWLDLYELEMMASYPTERNMIRVQNFDSLNSIVNTIRDAACDNVNECSSNPCSNGQCSDGIRYYWCECFDGWSGVNCDQRCENGGDVVFAVDSSGSIGENNFKELLSVVIDIAERLEIDKANTNDRGFRVGMVTFGNDATIRFNLNDYLTKPEILSAMSVLYSSGTTNTASAIRMIREQMFTSNNGDRSNVPNYIVILTDGRSDNRDATWREAQAARQAGIHIISVGIGNGVLEDELRGMASGPLEGNVIQVNDFASLRNVINTLSTGLCNNEDECRSNPCRNGARCTDGIYGFTCGPCPEPFTGSLCERGCSGTADVVFVIDSSGSIRSERFPRVLEFIESIVNELDVHPDRTRIGLVYWSDGAEVGFYLSQFRTRDEVIINLWRTPFLGGRTHTSSALTMLRDSVFTNSRGDRDLVPNYAIILTDGNSNINPATTVPEAIQDRVQGIHLMVVAVGEDINRQELEGIASDPKDENIFTVDSIRDLSSLQQNIISSICDDEDECRSSPCRNGGRCINQLKKYQCQCQPEYGGFNCERRCTRQLDVVFLLDLSGSVFEEYRLTVDFAKEVVYGLNMQFDRVRVGAIAFATDIIDRFYMNTYQNKEGVINALNFYNKGGRTDTGRALRLARDEFFSSNRGDRSGVNNVIILVSDGFSTEGSVQNVVDDMKRRGIEFYTIGTGDSPNVGELGDIATDPDSEHDFRLPDENAIREVADRLLDQLCQ